MKRIKARKSHVCHYCRREIKPGTVYIFEATVKKWYDGLEGDWFERYEIRLHEKCKKRQINHTIRRKIWEEKVLKHGQINVGGKWYPFNYRIKDVLRIEPKRGRIVVEYRDMVTDDPFPMYEDIVREYEFRIGGDK